MKNIINKVISVTLVCSFCMGMVSFAESVSIKYSGTAEPDSMVGFMVVDADADASNLSEDDLYLTDIVKVGKDGKFEKTVEYNESAIDAQGKLADYKVLSNIELEEQLLGENYSFERFTVSPVEENGVLYVPIEETLDLIGGETVSYTYNEETKTYTGDANNGEFIIIMGENTVDVDWVDIELPGILKEINGTNMMPAYAIKYLLKTGDVKYTAGDNFFKLSEGVKAKNTTWDTDINDVIDRLPNSTGTLLTPEMYIRESGNFHTAGNFNATDTTVDVEIGGKAYKARQIDTNPNEYGEMGLLRSRAHISNSVGLAKGEIGLLSFKARATKITDESGVANIWVHLEAPNWQKAIREQVPITGYWQQFYFPAYNVYHDMPGGDSYFQIQIEGKPMTVQIADLSIVSFGKNDEVKKLIMPEREGYKGIEEDAVWRQEAWNRIEKYRKEDISVEVVDNSGNPVQGASIDVNMTENEFMFGAALCENEVLDEYIDTSTDKGAKLDSFMNNNMNVGVVADMLKAPQVAETDASISINMVDEFLSRGKRVRGHAVFWDNEGHMPFDRSNQLSYEEIYKRTMDYIRPLAYTFKGKLAQWDVLNEPHDTNHTRSNYNTTRLYTDVFKEVRKIDPDVKLYVNETGIEGRPNRTYQDRIPNFLNIVKQMQAEGAPIDGIGIQAHCTTYYYPQGFYHQLDECAQIVDEVAVTEYDFQNVNDTYNPNHLEDTLLATFSHPKATAFIVWGVEDSMHWRGTDDAPFFNRDWSEKPTYAMWQKLINQDFATNTTLTTDTEGKANIRAFRGDYEITCTYNGKTRTIPLGNTVDGGSSVKFVVGNTINATASNDVREQFKPIEFNNMTEAKKELDSITKPYYKGVILDRNFKGSEATEIVTEGGDIKNNSGYQSGKTWGSINGTGEILYGGNWSSTIIHPNGTAQTGDIRLKAEGTERYVGTELHHETMFYTLESEASGSVNISTGVSTAEHNDTKLAEIVYNNGSYSVKAIDGYEMGLDKNKLYMLDTAIADNMVEYIITLSNEVVAEYKCTLNGTVDTQTLTEVFYRLDANCAEDDVFMLHNARLFEYKDGELIEFSDTDYETYVLDEDMRGFDAPTVEYLGATLTKAPENWVHIGSTSAASSFDYLNNGMYFGSVAHEPLGEHAVVKGFAKIQDNESIELTFNGYIGAYSKWMDITGRGGISIGSHDKSVMLDIAQMRYRQYNDSNGSPYDLWLLNKNNSSTPTEKIPFAYNSIFSRNRVFVKLMITPSETGRTYDARLSIKSRTGSSEITASYPNVFTAEEAKKIDTIFISSHASNSGTKYNGQMMFGVKDIKIRKYGKTVCTNGEASIAQGDSASLGIMYNNVTRVYKDAEVIVAGYDSHDALVYCDVVKHEMKPGIGSFDFNIDNQADGAVKYRVFLVNGTDSIMPYKSDDVITIK